MKEILSARDVGLMWDWRDDEKSHLQALEGTEKPIVIHNRNKEYIYNLQISAIELGDGLIFDSVNEIGPDARQVAVGRWDGRSSQATN